MPFKGDMRLGGPHDNEGTLNGTSSEFNSVPEAGTILSGPTDTSRYENDFLGTPFYMPYSTTVYADGLGGQTSVETWGLQYYPAGWVTATSQNPLYLSFGPYVLLGDGTVTLSGTWNYAVENINHIEDGTGINYTAVISTTYAESNGFIIASDSMGTGADRWRVVYNSTTHSGDIWDNSESPIYGTSLGSGSVPVNYSAPCQNFEIGVQGVQLIADGYGGETSSLGSITFNSASYLGHCGDQTNGWLFYHHDGNGNVTQGHPPAGFVLYSASSSSSFAWSAPDGASGNYAYATSTSTETAVGDGNISYGGDSWNAPDGQEIHAGSYVSGQGVDENGGTYDIIQNFTVNFTNHESAGGANPVYYTINNV